MPIIFITKPDRAIVTSQDESEMDVCDSESVTRTFSGSKNMAEMRMPKEQESCAIAKMTARCALYK